MAQTDSLGVQYSDDWKILQRCPESFSGSYTPAVGTKSIASGAFRNCVKLSALTIPKSITDIGRNAFSGCKTLNTIYYDGSVLDWLRLQWDGYVDVGYALWIKQKATDTLFSNQEGNYAKVTSVVIPKEITSIREGAFYYCNSLSKVSFHSNVQEIGESAFNKSNVGDTTLPESLKSIGKYAFLSCKSLKSVFIPSSVSFIGDGTFSYCTYLASIEVDEDNSCFCSNKEKNVLLDKFKTTLIQCVCKPKYAFESIYLEKTCKTIRPYALVGCGEFSIYFKSQLKEKAVSVKDCKCHFKVPYGSKANFIENGFPAPQITEQYSEELLIRSGSEHLDIVTNNPFRILGVASNAPQKEIAANTTKIKRFSAAGKTVSYITDFESFLGPVNRSQDNVETSLSRINLPEDKIKHALFWFLNTNEVDSKALQLLSNDGLDAFSDYYDENGDNGTACRINSNATCLIRKREWLEVFIQELPDLLSNEQFTDDFVSKVCGDNYVIDKDRLSELFIDTLLDECDAKQLYLLYSDAYSTTKEKCAEYVKEKIIGEYESKINGEIKIARAVPRDDAEKNLKAAKNLISRTKTAIQAAREFLTESDPQYVVIADALAKQILQSGINYYNNSSDDERPYKAMEVQSYAESLAVGDLAKKRCEENTAILRRIIDSLPPKACKGIDDELDVLIADSSFDTIENIIAFLKRAADIIVKIRTLKESEAKTKDEIAHYSGFIKSVSTAIGAKALNESIDVFNAFMESSISMFGLSTIEKAWECMCYIGSLDLDDDYRAKRFDPNNKTMGEIYDREMRRDAPISYGIALPRSMAREVRRPQFSLDFRTESELFEGCKSSPIDCITYISKYPQGRFIAQVKSYNEDFDWKACRTLDNYKSYISRYPDGKYTSEAKSKIQDYESGKSEINSMSSINQLLSICPKYKGTYLNDVLDEKFYSLCRTKADCRKYVSTFSYGKHKEEAQERINKTHEALCWILAIVTMGLIGGLIAGEDNFWAGVAAGTLGNLILPVVYLPYMLFSYLIDGPKE